MQTQESAITQTLTAAATLFEKIKHKTITVGVIGLGYVGLPFLVEKAKVGLSVIGLDYSLNRINLLKSGQSYIDDVSDEHLQQAFNQSRVLLTDDYAELAKADVIVICVPTPLDKNQCPDLQYVISVSHELRKTLRPGQLISLESTTYPGTTSEVIKPILEASGLTAGKDFFLAH